MKEIFKERIIPDSPTKLDEKTIKKIHSYLPVPTDYKIIWADVKFGGNPSGIVFTEQAMIIKADINTLKEYNKAKDKSERKRDLYTLIKWEFFDVNNFKCAFGKIAYNDSLIYSSDDNKLFEDFLAEYKSKDFMHKIETDLLLSNLQVANLAAAENAVHIMNFAKVNAKLGHGVAAEEGGAVLEKLKGVKVDVVGRNNAKNGPDKIIYEKNKDSLSKVNINEINIQCKYCKTGKDCINACFESDSLTGLRKFRYYNNDGSPMLIEVPKDMYYDAINQMKIKIKKGEVPGVTDPNDAPKYIKKGLITYKQAVNLTKFGKLESLAYDAINGVVKCSFALGISALITFSIYMYKDKDVKKASIEAIKAGIKVFGFSFLTHVLNAQLARTNLSKAFISVSEYLINILGNKGTHAIVNAIRALNGKSPIYGAAAKKNLNKILRNNLVMQLVVFIVFSIPDTFRVLNKKISKAQYSKNIFALAGGLVGGAGGAVAGGLAGAKIGAAVGAAPGLFGKSNFIAAVGGAVGGGVGFAGGIVGGFSGSFIAKKSGDLFKEDDIVIASRLFNAVIINLCYEYMLQEKEINKLIDKLDKIPKKELEKLLSKLWNSKNQYKDLETYLEKLFEDIVKERDVIAPPTVEDISNAILEVVKDLEEEVS